MKRVAFHCDGPGCTSTVEVLPTATLAAVRLPQGWLRLSGRMLVDVRRDGGEHGQAFDDEVCSGQCAVRRVAALLAAMGDSINETPCAAPEREDVAA